MARTEPQNTSIVVIVNVQGFGFDAATSLVADRTRWRQEYPWAPGSAMVALYRLSQAKPAHQGDDEQQPVIDHQKRAVEGCAIRSSPRDSGFTESASWLWENDDLKSIVFPRRPCYDRAKALFSYRGGISRAG